MSEDCLKGVLSVYEITQGNAENGLNKFIEV